MADGRERDEALVPGPSSATVVRRVTDRVRGLGPAQKALFWVFALVCAFLVSFLVTVALLKAVGFGKGSSPDSGAAPSGGSAVAEETDPDLRVSGARWEGERVVVEGTWRGDVSSVHCDLFEGGGEGTVTDWWDRKGRTRMDWSRRSFSQEFYEARGREIEDPIDPGVGYRVDCRALFSGGEQAGDEGPVEGTPRR